jgi:hypothetical protein
MADNTADELLSARAKDARLTMSQLWVTEGSSGVTAQLNLNRSY